MGVMGLVAKRAVASARAAWMKPGDFDRLGAG